ncbi:hypothetical protein [Sphingopyxis sp. MWB1]|uniref:hypothetical protein n=1 Tax=Sphingopyxis sp. MWB1 TaxID=1537715 RepID=UPI001362C1F2|nr:hypothetical protein [Sphingopyxis sp. MWB1]
MNRSVFLSLLAMDSYQRGSAVGIRGVTGTAIGKATIRDLELPANSLAIGFCASDY